MGTQPQFDRNVPLSPISALPALIPQLRRRLGNLADGELYCRDREVAANAADQYEKLTMEQAFARRPSEIRYSFAIDDEGSQRIVEQTIELGAG